MKMNESVSIHIHLLYSIMTEALHPTKVPEGICSIMLMKSCLLYVSIPFN